MDVPAASALATACGGFLLAVLWMDLMFDVQALRGPRGAALPESALASIAGYYRRVTTDARPLPFAVAAVMALLLVALGVELVAGSRPRALTLLSLLVAGAPIALALARTLPNAIRLGARSDPPAEQSRLARAIARDHGLCLVAILGFLALRVGGA